MSQPVDQIQQILNQIQGQEDPNTSVDYGSQPAPDMGPPPAPPQMPQNMFGAPPMGGMSPMGGQGLSPGMPGNMGQQPRPPMMPQNMFSQPPGQQPQQNGIGQMIQALMGGQ